MDKFLHKNIILSVNVPVLVYGLEISFYADFQFHCSRITLIKIWVILLNLCLTSYQSGFIVESLVLVRSLMYVYDIIYLLFFALQGPGR